MKKLCVIGNSQVNSLKLGYESWKNKSYVASFWCISGGAGPRIEIKNNKIYAPESKSKEVLTDMPLPPGSGLDISRFDAILLSGIGIPAIKKQEDKIHSKYVVAGFVDTEMEMDRQILSKAMFSEIIRESLHSKQSLKNIQKVATIFKKKIFIQMFPLPTPILVELGQSDVRNYGRNLYDFLSWYYIQQRLVIEEHLKGKNASLVAYPKNWFKVGYSPIKYKKEKDAWHLNRVFGEYIMGELMSKWMVK